MRRRLSTTSSLYYQKPVAAGGSTDTLFTGCSLKAGVIPPDGYHLTVEILGSGIQSQPRHVAETVWGVAIGTDGKLS